MAFILAGVAVRRFLHRVSVGAFRGRRGGTKPKATPVRFLITVALTILFSCMIAVQVIHFSTTAIAAVASAVEDRCGDPSVPRLSDEAYRDLAALANEFAAARAAAAGTPAGSLDPSSPSSDARLRKIFQDEAEYVILDDSNSYGGPRHPQPPTAGSDQAKISALRDHYLDVFSRKGLAGFRMRPWIFSIFWPSTVIWPGAQGPFTLGRGWHAVSITGVDGYGNPTIPGSSREDVRLMLAAVGVLMTLIFAMVVMNNLGMANQDLAKVEWDLEWLFTFPVSSSSLFHARVFEYAFVNIWGWAIVTPFLVTLCVVGGYGWWAVPLAIAAAACFNLFTGAAHMLIEVALRAYLSMRRVKSIQALATVAGLVLLYAMLSLAFSPLCLKPVVAVASALGPVMVSLPWSLPALLNAGGALAVAGMVASAATAVVAVSASAGIAGRLTSGGLVREANVYSGVRGEAPRKESLSFLKGIVGKDIKLLIRDRAFLVRVFVIPLCVIGFQLLVNQSILRAGFSNFDRACAIAYGVAAFVLLSGAMNALSYEGKAIWLLFTFPFELEAILRRKALFWWMVSSIYAAAFLAYAATRTPVSLANVSGILTAMAGILPLSFLAVGLGAVGAKPLAAVGSNRLPVWLVYLFMILTAMYIPAIYLPYDILRVLAFVLWCLLAFAVWRYVRGRLSLILDQP